MTRVRAKARVIHTSTSRGGVLLDPASKAYFELNATGDRLWKAIAEPASIPELVALLVGEHGVAQDRAEADVKAWVAELRAAELLDEVP